MARSIYDSEKKVGGFGQDEKDTVDFQSVPVPEYDEDGPVEFAEKRDLRYVPSLSFMRDG